MIAVFKIERCRINKLLTGLSKYLRRYRLYARLGLANLRRDKDDRKNTHRR